MTQPMSKPGLGFCDKPDRDMEIWNQARPDKPPRTMKCGYPLPCPYHTVVIETTPARVHIPPEIKLTQRQRKEIRRMAVILTDALEERA
jgi:hypothetical protein